MSDNRNSYFRTGIIKSFRGDPIDDDNNNMLTKKLKVCAFESVFLCQRWHRKKGLSIVLNEMHVFSDKPTLTVYGVMYYQVERSLPRATHEQNA